MAGELGRKLLDLQARYASATEDGYRHDVDVQGQTRDEIAAEYESTLRELLS